jgi:hypothetical protein
MNKRVRPLFAYATRQHWLIENPSPSDPSQQYEHILGTVSMHFRRVGFPHFLRNSGTRNDGKADCQMALRGTLRSRRTIIARAGRLTLHRAN